MQVMVSLRVIIGALFPAPSKKQKQSQMSWNVSTAMHSGSCRLYGSGLLKPFRAEASPLQEGFFFIGLIDSFNWTVAEA